MSESGEDDEKRLKAIMSYVQAVSIEEEGGRVTNIRINISLFREILLHFPNGLVFQSLVFLFI